MGLNYPKNQGTEWINMKQQIKNAFTSANSRVPYQKIAAGVLKVSTSIEILAGAILKFFYSNGSEGIYIGQFTVGGNNSEGLIVNKRDGGFALSSYTDVVTNRYTTTVWDGSGNIVLSNDANSAQGIARPWLSHTFATTSELTTPPSNHQATTTSDTTIYSTITPVQHPRLTFTGYVYIQTAGATAEVKIKNITTGTTMYASTQADGWLTGDMDMPVGWGFGVAYQLDITVRRASGSGNVGFTLASFHGRQS